MGLKNLILQIYLHFRIPNKKEAHIFMPISINYCGEKNVIYTKAEGVIVLDDVMSYFSSVAALNLQNEYSVFADYTDAILEISSKEIKYMAEQRKKTVKVYGKIKIAVFCNHDLVFGLGRMYEAFLGEDNYSVMIFRKQQEAKKWLGLE